MKLRKESPTSAGVDTRGGAARGLKVCKCERCGTRNGYVPPDQVRPSRRSGARFGIDGAICNGCHACLFARWKAAGGRSDQKRPDGSLEDWSARYAAVRADVLARAAGYEAEDRNPLEGLYRAPATPVVAEDWRGRVARLRRGWRKGPEALLEAAGLIKRKVKEKGFTNGETIACSS